MRQPLRRTASPLALPFLIVAGALAAAGSGCRAPAASPLRSDAPDTTDIVARIHELYATFDFDANAEPDWTGMRALAADGATFVAPIAEGATPRGVGTEEFVDDFREFVLTSPLRETGFHERITHLRVDTFGAIAHAWVVFEGFVPGEPASRRGLDSIQLVRDGEEWRVASFTTQYESENSALPARFTRAADRVATR